MTDLLAYRDRFPILEHTKYLINHSLGAMPEAVGQRELGRNPVRSGRWLELARGRGVPLSV